MSLAPAQRTEAIRLRAFEPPMSWGAIGLRLQCSSFLLKCEMVEGYRDYHRERVRCRRNGLPIPQRMKSERPVHRHGATHGPQPPYDVMAERDMRLALEPQSLTAFILGDPAPGRSAWDRACGRKPLFERLRHE